MRKNNSIARRLNSITRKSIRWCTPSIILNQEQVINPYISDMSVSFEGLGFPSEPSSIFLEAYKKASRAYGSEKTLFSVNGSTGSIFIVLRALSKQIPNLRILAQRNIHKSVLNACQDYDINILFVDSHIDPHLQIFLPNSIEQIIQSLKKTKPHVLLITNPTYEGLVLNMKKLVKEVRRISPRTIIFVDEAWGSHLAFSEKLPHSAMQAGVDICVQSVHKQGGALQQTSIIHWKEKRINSYLIMDSYRRLTTTSPSYTLLASIDAAREVMEKDGARLIEKSLKIANKLEVELEKIPGFKIVRLKHLVNKTTSAYDRDNTKVLVDVSKSGHTGYDLAKTLEQEFNIIIEKYNAVTLLFLVPFQSSFEDVDKTVIAIKNIIASNGVSKDFGLAPVLDFPLRAPRILELREVSKLLQGQVEIISLKDAKGRISAENITPYPPGIPTTIQGEEFTAKVISFYQNIHHYPNSHIMANDISLETVLVVK